MKIKKKTIKKYGGTPRNRALSPSERKRIEKSIADMSATLAKDDERKNRKIKRDEHGQPILFFPKGQEPYGKLSCKPEGSEFVEIRPIGDGRLGFGMSGSMAIKVARMKDDPDSCMYKVLEKDQINWPFIDKPLGYFDGFVYYALK